MTQVVGGADEEHFAEVDGDVELVVHEGVVLAEVQDLQQCRTQVTLPEPHAHFVDLVQQNQGVLEFGPPQRLDDLAGLTADLGAPVALQLAHVVLAAQADAEELPPQRFGDAFGDAGLPHPGRPTQTQDLARHVALEDAHADELEHAVFDVLHALVVPVQHTLGLQQIVLLPRKLSPGDGRYDFELIDCERLVN